MKFGLENRPYEREPYLTLLQTIGRDLLVSKQIVES